MILSLEGVNFIDTEGDDTVKKIAQMGKQRASICAWRA